MKHTREQHLVIGHQVYMHEISIREAMDKYNLSRSAIDKCLTDYKRENGIPIRKRNPSSQTTLKINSADACLDIDTYMAMSKEELIDELILAKVNEARAKKGYEVKGVGANKVFNSLNNKNSK